jgi:hypothetical protein
LECLLNAMGFKHLNQLRQYRRLLKRPNKVWLHADNIPGGRLRKHISGDTVIPVTQSEPPHPLMDEKYKRLFKRIWHNIVTYHAVYKGDIDEFCAWLDALRQSEFVVD